MHYKKIIWIIISTILLSQIFAISTQNNILYYNFDNALSIVDLTSNQGPATNNGAEFSNNSIINKSLYFNNTQNDYITLATSINFTSSTSINLWINGNGGILKETHAGTNNFINYDNTTNAIIIDDGCTTINFTHSNIPNWYNQKWQYRINITINSSKINSDLSYFPIYIDLSSMPEDFFNLIKNDGGDIRITKDDGITEVAREIVFVNTTTNTGEIHFNSSGTLSSTIDTTYFIYFGNQNANDYIDTHTYGTHNVWDNRYRLISHDGGKTDSTRYNNDGTGNGSIAGGEATGVVGKATYFNGESQYFTLPNLGDFDFPNGVAYTVSAWIKTPGGTGATQVIVDTRLTRGWGFTVANTGYISNFIRDNNDDTTTWSSTKTYNNNSWNFVATSYKDNEEGKTYGNGELDDLDTINEISDKSSSSATITIGYKNNLGSVWGHYLGYLDEIRIIRGVDYNENWINTTYNNQYAPSSFYSIGEIENNWNMITITRNETNSVKAYLNQEQIDTTKTLSCTFDINHIGRGNSTNYFNGYMDEISIWTKELSQSEIIELYNSGNGLTYTNFTQTTEQIEETNLIGIFPFWNLLTIIFVLLSIYYALR